jgi:hypothetical protein
MEETLGPLIATRNRELVTLAQEVYYNRRFFVVECRETYIIGPNLFRAHMIRRLLVVIRRFEIPSGVRCSQVCNSRCFGVQDSYHPTLFKLRTQDSVTCKSHGRPIEQLENLGDDLTTWQRRFNRLDCLNFRFVFLQGDYSQNCIHMDSFEEFMCHVTISLAARVVAFRFYPYQDTHWTDRLDPTLPDINGVIRHRCVCAQKLEEGFHQLMERKG